MNDSYSRSDEKIQMPAAMSVIVLVCVLAAIIFIGRLALRPVEVSAVDATSFVAPFEATAMSADGRMDNATPPTAVGTAAVAGQPALVHSRSP
jgi:hypothetical protein